MPPSALTQSRILLQAQREVPASHQPSSLNTAYRSGTAPGRCRSLLQLRLTLLQVQEKELTNVSTSAQTVAITLCISVNTASTNFVDFCYHFQIPRRSQWLKSNNYAVDRLKCAMDATWQSFANWQLHYQADMTEAEDAKMSLYLPYSHTKKTRNAGKIQQLLREGFFLCSVQHQF